MYTTLNTRHAMPHRAYGGFGEAADPALIALPLAPVVDPVGVSNLGLALVMGANLEPVMKALTQRYFIQDSANGTTTTGRVFLMGDKQVPPGTMVGPEMIAASVVQAAIAGGRVAMISCVPGPDGLFSLVFAQDPQVIAVGAAASADGSSMFAILGDQPTALIMAASAARKGLTSTKPALVSTRPTLAPSLLSPAQAVMAAQQAPPGASKAVLVVGGILVVLGLGYLATKKSSGNR